MLRLGLFNCLKYFPNGMPIDGLGKPSKCLEFTGQIIHFHDVGCKPVHLLLVIINKGNHIGQFIVIRKQRHFPDLAFITFTVPQDQVQGIDSGQHF